jgi:hypothetical protein
VRVRRAKMSNGKERLKVIIYAISDSSSGNGESSNSTGCFSVRECCNPHWKLRTSKSWKEVEGDDGRQRYYQEEQVFMSIACSSRGEVLRWIYQHISKRYLRSHNNGQKHKDAIWVKKEGANHKFIRPLVFP